MALLFYYMMLRPPISTRTDTLFPSTSPYLSPGSSPWLARSDDGTGSPARRVTRRGDDRRSREADAERRAPAGGAVHVEAAGVGLDYPPRHREIGRAHV